MAEDERNDGRANDAKNSIQLGGKLRTQGFLLKIINNTPAPTTNNDVAVPIGT